MLLSRILLVEGKRAIKSSFRDAIGKKFDVAVASSGNEASALILSYKPDVIVCDATHMRTNGERICQRLKKMAPNIPLVHCLKEGGDVTQELSMADEVIIHPFTSRKLINRIRTVIPASETDSEVVREGDISLYLGKRSVVVKDKAQQVVDEIQVLLRKGQQINFDFQGTEEDSIKIDPQIFKNILINLLSNAIKYSQEGKEIVLGIDMLAQEMKVRVKDNGMGISESEQVHIFERFFRADAARAGRMQRSCLSRSWPCHRRLDP